MAFRLRLVKAAIDSVKFFVLSLPDPGASGFKSTSVAGKKIKIKIKARVIPLVMIHPKSMTGRMPLIKREQKATMVVIEV